MTILALQSVDSADHLVHPEEYWDLGLRSSALSLLTDFRRHEPQVIDGWMLAVDADRFLRQSRAKLRLVVDHDGEFIGIITVSDLAEARLVKRVAGGEPREAIRVIDVMTPRRDIRALSYNDLRGATVGDVIETLRCNGEQHCLVVDGGDHRIRGLIAASDVAARLHTNINVSTGPTFAEIFAAVHH
ncbi:MAG: CBS domain-containing protein [Pseudomonadales bacterium]